MSRLRVCRSNVVFTCTAIVMTSGCSTESTESVNIATPAIWVNIDIDAVQTGSTRVNVELNVGGANGTNIELSTNERLEATLGSVTKVLQKDTDLFDIDYVAHFSTSSSAQPVRIAFFRADGSIHDNTVVGLPDEFLVTSPQAGQTFASSSTIPIAWTPFRNGRMINIDLFASCATLTGSSFGGPSIAVADDGFENYDLGNHSVINAVDIDRSKPCGLIIRVYRVESGTLDPAFEAGGTIEAVQSREVDNITVTLQ